MKKFCYMLGIFGFICLAAQAADWIQTGQKSYLDKSSITKYDNIPSRNNVYSFWTKNLYNNNEMDRALEKEYRTKYWYAKVFALIDCSRKETATKMVTWFNLQEKPIYGGPLVLNDYNLQWFPIIPETGVEGEYNYMCKPLNNSDNLYPSLDISSERLDEMRDAWIYGEKKCADLSDTDPNFAEKYGHFYNCQGEYLEKFGKDFDNLYNYCTAGSMSKYTKCVENVLNIR